MSSSSMIQEMKDSKPWDESFEALTKGLTSLIGRIPTRDEVKDFIYSDEKAREAFLRRRLLTNNLRKRYFDDGHKDSS